MNRILLVVTRAELGGAQRVVLELAERLTALGHAVTVASGEDGWLLDQARAKGIGVRRFRYLRRTANPFFHPLFALELFLFLRKSPEPVVVHLNSSNALAGSLGAKLAGSRTVFTVHGLSVLDTGYETGPLLRAAYWAWFRLWFLFTDRVVAVSQGNATRLRELGVAKRIDVVPNGIDASALSFLSREDARAELGVPDDVPLILTLGRLEYSKRQELLIRALPGLRETMPDTRLALISNGPERETLESLAAELDVTDAVVFAGERPRGYELMRAADVFVLPSRYEGWPMVLLEALAAGMPIVASDVGGIGEQVGDAAELLSIEAGPAEWAAALGTLLKDEPRRRELSVLAAQRAKLWTAETMTASYAALYED